MHVFKLEAKYLFFIQSSALFSTNTVMASMGSLETVTMGNTFPGTGTLGNTNINTMGTKLQHESENKHGANKSKPVKKNFTRRGWGNKNKRKQYKNKQNQSNFSIFASNANGIKGKLDSLKTNINIFQPSCIILQETKLKFPGTIKIDGYQVFENLREGLGGGLFTAIDNSLNPVLISTGNEDFEAIIIQVQIG